MLRQSLQALPAAQRWTFWWDKVVKDKALGPVRHSAGYAALAGRLRTTEAAIKMAVVRLRRRFGQLLRAKVRQTVNNEAELNEELRYLFTAFAS